MGKISDIGTVKIFQQINIMELLLKKIKKMDDASKSKL